MKRIDTIEELHRLLLEIGKEFHRICVKNDIPYYMLGGTQLGATRHKGFIPWDDDMDFGIPREHYDRFQKIAETELTKQYSLLTVDNSKRVISDISKLVLNTTVIEEEFVKDPAMQIGVFIDIFPLDRTDGNLGCLSKNKWIRYLIDLSGYRYLSLHNRPFFKKTLAVIVKFFLAPVPPKSIVNFIKKRLITGSGDHIANHYGAWKTKEIMPEKHFGQPQLYPFEDTEFYGVSDPNGYLSHLYGEWKKLPPEDKRHIHLLNMYYK